MNDEQIGSVEPVHWSFWTISAIALIWYLMSVLNYFAQMDPDTLAQYSESARSIVEDRPAWATGAFAIAAFGGTLGCLLLLFRKSVAFYVLIASLLGTISTMVHTLTVAGPNFSTFEIFMMIVLPLLVAGILVWYSKLAERKGWVS